VLATRRVSIAALALALLAGLPAATPTVLATVDGDELQATCGDPEVVATAAHRGGAPAMPTPSGDGTRMAYVADGRIYRHDRPGNLSVRLTPQLEDVTYQQLALDERGAVILYDLDKEDPDADEGLWALRASDAARHQLVSGPVTGIAISQDASRAAFISDADLTGDNSDHSTEAFLLDLETEDLVQITDDAGQAWTATGLSDDPDRVFLLGPVGTRVWVFDLDAEDYVPTPVFLPTSLFSVSSDGSTVQARDQIYDTSDGSSEAIPVLTPNLPDSIRMSADTSTVTYLSSGTAPFNLDGGIDVFALNRLEDTIDQLTHTLPSAILDWDLSPGGTTLVTAASHLWPSVLPFGYMAQLHLFEHDLTGSGGGSLAADLPYTGVWFLDASDDGRYPIVMKHLSGPSPFVGAIVTDGVVIEHDAQMGIDGQLELAPHGHHLAEIDEGDVEVFDALGTPLGLPATNGHDRLQWSPGGTRLGVWDEDGPTLEVIDLSGKTIQHTLTSATSTEFDSPAEQRALGDDGTLYEARSGPGNADEIIAIDGGGTHVLATSTTPGLGLTRVIGLTDDQRLLLITNESFGGLSPPVEPQRDLISFDLESGTFERLHRMASSAIASNRWEHATDGSVFAYSNPSGVQPGAADVVVIECGPSMVFSDVPPSHPFYGPITHMADQGVLRGFPDGTFRPSATVTRQAMAAFLYRLAGEPAFDPPEDPSFSDVATSHPFFAEIEWLAADEITTGFPDGTYKPGAVVTRQAMAAFMYRMAGEPDFEPPGTPTFTDVPTTHPFFAEIEWMAAESITTGFPDDTYRPEATVTRQAMAAFLERIQPLL